MRRPRLLAGYVIRVAVRGDHWHLSLLDLHDGSIVTFPDFAALAAHLELAAVRLAVPGPPGPPASPRA